MIKDKIIEDLEDTLNREIDVTLLPYSILEEIATLEKLYKSILYEKSMKQYSKRNIFKRSKKEQDRLYELKKEYKEKFDKTASEIKAHMQKQNKDLKTNKAVNINSEDILKLLSTSPIKELKCPNCGAPLNTNNMEKGYITCEFCGAKFTTVNIEKIIENLTH